jgi:hypothetical protein
MDEKVLTKGDIVNVKDIQVKKVNVPEWGGSIFIKVMSGTEKDAFELAAYDKKSPVFGKIRAGLCARCICDADGNRMFSDDPAEIESLGNRSGVALERIFDAARKLNKMSEKEIEELEKNFVSDPGAGSLIV